MLLFLIGPSASGKGTQAKLLSEKYSIPALSMGAILREEVSKGTTIGILIGQIINEGNLVASEVTNEILTKKLSDAHVNEGGAILDGYPRMFEQAVDIQPLVDKMQTVFRVVHYKLSYEECVKRQESRIKEGVLRGDDHSLEERYKEYLIDIDKITDYYKNLGILIEIDASPSKEAIFEETCHRLEESIAAHLLA